MDPINPCDSPSGAPAPDQRDVGPHLHTIGSKYAKPTAHPGAEPPSTQRLEDHNLPDPYLDPARDPELGNTIGEAGMEVPAYTAEEIGPPGSHFRLPEGTRGPFILRPFTSMLQRTPFPVCTLSVPVLAQANFPKI